MADPHEQLPSAWQWFMVPRVNDFSVSVALPLDDDGFLRRECPACKRECKWFYAEDSDPEPTDGYACPYCAKRARSDHWFTPAQAEYVTAKGGGEMMDSILDQFKSSGTFQVTKSPPPAPLTEPNDMRRVDFACHPTEPVKVLDDWSDPVRCIVCAAKAT